MKKQYLIILALFPLLASCSKTAELYKDFAYNSPDFMKNYYTETSGVRDNVIESRKDYSLVKNKDYYSANGLEHIKPEDNPDDLPWSIYGEDKSGEFGRNYNLSKIESSFAYGYLSKLYDGRVRCEGKYQLSRVQLDKHGFATYFPKKLANFKYFAISLRGATDYENTHSNPSPLKGSILVDLHISFYQHIDNSTKYNVINFDLTDVDIPCDNGGDTNLVSFYLANDSTYGGETIRHKLYDLDNTVAMSMTYELKTTRPDLTDDLSIEKEHHFAVMLYEVMFPRSAWY